MLGLIAGYRGSASEAAELFGQALTLNPEYREARINLTICLAEMGAGDQAAEEASRLQAGEPTEPGGPDRATVGALANAHADLASKYHALGMFAEAVGEYDKALTLCPHFPDLHLRRAASCREQGDHAGAMASLRRTLELKPDYAEALVNLGLLHQMMGNRAEAIAAWERALALDPTHSLARIYLAQAPPRATGG
jgi:tetratricopeptide (TPR) repeat protein